MFSVKNLFVFSVLILFAYACQKSDPVRSSINPYEGDSKSLKAISDQLVKLDVPVDGKIDWTKTKLLLSTGDTLYKLVLPIVSTGGKISSVLIARTGQDDVVRSANVSEDSLIVNACNGKKVNKSYRLPKFQKSTGTTNAARAATCTINFYSDVLIDYYVNSLCSSQSQVRESVNRFLTSFMAPVINEAFPGVRVTVEYGAGSPIRATGPTGVLRDDIAYLIEGELNLGLNDLQRPGGAGIGCEVVSATLLMFQRTGSDCPPDALVTESYSFPFEQGTVDADKIAGGTTASIGIKCNATVERYVTSRYVHAVTAQSVTVDRESVEYTDILNRKVTRKVTVSNTNYFYGQNPTPEITFTWNAMLTAVYTYPNGEAPVNTRQWNINYTVNN